MHREQGGIGNCNLGADGSGRRLHHLHSVVEAPLESIVTEFSLWLVRQNGKGNSSKNIELSSEKGQTLHSPFLSQGGYKAIESVHVLMSGEQFLEFFGALRRTRFAAN